MASSNQPPIPPDSPAPDASEATSGLRSLKGTDIHWPVEQIRRAGMVDALRTTFEQFGFSPAETPILQHFDILASKYAGGAEILKETYKLYDQGQRPLGLRYDLTVPFATMIGMGHAQVRLPFKRYEIGRVFRDGPVSPGRRREFYQCDVDVVGVSSMGAEAELLALADMAFHRLRIGVRCQLNHRGFLTALLAELGVAGDQATDAILSLDKLVKVGDAGVKSELAAKGFNTVTITGILSALSIGKDVDPTQPEPLFKAYAERHVGNPALQAALTELRALYQALADYGVTLPVAFVPTLARGLTIYTGPVFEFFLTKPHGITGAVAAGGRYDRIIGDILGAEGVSVQGEGGASPFPTVGLSFGLEPLSEYLNEKAKDKPARSSVTDVLIVPLPGQQPAARRLASAMRRLGMNVDVEARDVRLKKSIQWADSNGIPFVAVVGEDEAAQNAAALKELASGKQEVLDAVGIRKRVLMWRDSMAQTMI